MNTTKKWGVYLLGHPFDLQDWADVLKQQFDPWVVQDGKEFVLRWSGFDGFETASDVQKRAGFLVEQLNGAMWIDRGTRPVRFDSIVAFYPDGTLQTMHMLEAASLEVRSRVTAAPMLITPAGTPVPPPPPKPSDVQEWVALAESDELLADTLIYSAHADWFNVYKAAECVRKLVKDRKLLDDKCIAQGTDFDKLKRTANSFRHRRDDPANQPPPVPMEEGEARQVLATLVRKAFVQAKCRTSVGPAGT